MKRILAIIGVVIIVGLYVATLIFGIVVNASETTRMLFRAALISTVLVPVFLYVIIWLHKVLSKYGYQEEELEVEERPDREKQNEEKL